MDPSLLLGISEKTDDGDDGDPGDPP